MKDLAQMNEMVQQKITESKKSSSGKVVPLKEALQAVFSRPNEDGMIGKITGPLKNELEVHDAWEKSIHELTEEAINALRNSKGFKPDAQVTYLVFLENLIAECKPLVSSEAFEKSIVEKISKAKIEVSKEAQKERKLMQMKNLVSPSEIAQQVLDEAQTSSPPPTAGLAEEDKETSPTSK